MFFGWDFDSTQCCPELQCSKRDTTSTLLILIFTQSGSFGTNFDLMHYSREYRDFGLYGKDGELELLVLVMFPRRRIPNVVAVQTTGSGPVRWINFSLEYYFTGFTPNLLFHNEPTFIRI